MVLIHSPFSVLRSSSTIRSHHLGRRMAAASSRLLRRRQPIAVASFPIQPLVVAVVAYEAPGFRIPAEAAVVEIGEVAEVADGHRAGADLHVADGRAAAADAV